MSIERPWWQSSGVLPADCPVSGCVYSINACPGHVAEPESVEVLVHRYDEEPCDLGLAAHEDTICGHGWTVVRKWADA